jgi:hypothetical protein
MSDSKARPLAQVVCRIPFLESVLFFVLFSGPPSFRHRDSQASLYGEMDAAVVFQLAVWLAAGLWLCYRLWKLRANSTFWSRFSSTHKIALILIVLLGISTFVSLAPALTAVKVYQVVVEMLFCWTFLQLYGLETCLRKIFWASAFLCIVIGVLAVLSPDSVWDFAEGTLPRLRGGSIVGTNSVSAFAMILLVTNPRAISRITFATALALFAVLQFLSLTRTSWMALAIIFLVAAIQRPKIRGLKWIYGALTLGVVALLVGGLTLISQFRDPDSIYDLSNRVGLWSYMSDIVIHESPWLGLGYTAATRTLGAEFDPELASGHSIFFDVFIGGGFISLAVFLALFIRLGCYSVRLLRFSKDGRVFAVCSLFLYVLIMGAVGETIDTSPFGFTFWMVASMLPMLIVSQRRRNAAPGSPFRNALMPSPNRGAKINIALP